MTVMFSRILSLRENQKKMKEILKKYYKTKAYLKVVNSAPRFQKEWNKLKPRNSKKIECVVVNMHAEYENILYNYPNENLNIEMVKSLEKKPVKRLILLGCNAGHYDFRDANLAFAFREKIEGDCIASDGTVVAFEKDEDDDFKLITENDSNWKEQRNKAKSKRKTNKGWIIYRKNLNIDVIGRKKITLKKLLKFK